MINKLLASVLEVAGKAVVEHLKKYGTKYLIGGGAAVVGGAVYAVGESVGHSKGKRKVLQNKPPVMKRKSKICIRIL